MNCKETRNISNAKQSKYGGNQYCRLLHNGISISKKEQRRNYSTLIWLPPYKVYNHVQGLFCLNHKLQNYLYVQCTPGNKIQSYEHQKSFFQQNSLEINHVQEIFGRLHLVHWNGKVQSTHKFLGLRAIMFTNTVCSRVHFIIWENYSKMVLILHATHLLTALIKKYQDEWLALTGRLISQ